MFRKVFDCKMMTIYAEAYRSFCFLAVASVCMPFTPTVVFDLDDRFLEAKENGLWLVMLYAPWCGHCKRLLPTFDQVARALSGSHVQVAKLDCTKYPSLANKLKVNGYPTIRLYRHGELFEYTGERTKEAIMDFTDKVTGYVSIAQPCLVCIKMHIRSKLVGGKSFEFSEDDGDLERWFQSERWPAFPLIKHETLYEIGTCCNKYLVVFVLDFVEKRKTNSPVKRYWSKYLSLKSRQFQLVWFDGNSLASSILLRAVPIPSLFAFNATSHYHYLPEDDMANLTEEALLLFLQRVDNGDVKVTIRAADVGWFNIMFSNQPLLACCLFGLPLGIASVICYTICSTDVSMSTDEVYDESDESGTDHEKAE
ncbi:protein disulfide isomerase TMX3 [Trichuris trichiura]|uniref:Protein disulfide isomerase TMX3 n=1 Tax=Trichuris trichiura TaxID=36087 RepID=A0A077Z9U6_TRITR|nr:protein disulfide isomerase TMX3 [Trichuris trichiura]